MSEIDQSVREITNAIKEVVRENQKHLSNAEADATGRHLEDQATAEQRDLESTDAAADAHDWYEPGDSQSLLLEAQSDGPWPLGHPDLPTTS